MKISNNLIFRNSVLSSVQASNINFKNSSKVNKSSHHMKTSIDFSPDKKNRLKNEELFKKIDNALEAKSIVQKSDDTATKIIDDLKKIKNLVNKIPADANVRDYMDKDTLSKLADHIDKLSVTNQSEIANIVKNNKSAAITSNTNITDNIIKMTYNLEGEGADTVVKSVSSPNNSVIAPNVAFSGGSGIQSSEAATYTIKGNTGTVSVGGTLVINGEKIEITDNFPMTKLADYINTNKEKFGVTAELQDSAGVNDTNLKLTALGQPGEFSKLTVEYKNGIHPEGPQAGKLEDAIVYGKTVMTSGVTELAKPATYTLRGNTGTVSVGGTLVINDQEIKISDNYSMSKLADYINTNKEKFGVTAELQDSAGVKGTNIKLTALGDAGPNSTLSIKFKDGLNPEGPQAGKLHDMILHGSDLSIVPGGGFTIDGQASKEGDFVVKGNTVTITKEGNSKGLTIEFSKAGADIQHGVAITGVTYEHASTTDLNVTIGNNSSEQYELNIKDMSSKTLKLSNSTIKELSNSIDKQIEKLETEQKYYKTKNKEIDKTLNSLLANTSQISHNDFNFSLNKNKDHFTGLFKEIKNGLYNNCSKSIKYQSDSINRNSALKLLI